MLGGVLKICMDLGGDIKNRAAEKKILCPPCSIHNECSLDIQSEWILSALEQQGPGLKSIAVFRVHTKMVKIQAILAKKKIKAFN